MAVSASEFLTWAIAFGVYPPQTGGGLTPIPANTFLGNTGGSSAVPTAQPLSALLKASDNLSDVDNVATARANLALESMAIQPANNVDITGGTAILSNISAPFTYADVPGDENLAIQDSLTAFVFPNPSVDLSDALGLSNYTDGFTFSLKNISSGNCTFTPFSGEFIDGMASLTIAAGAGYLITKDPTQWSIISTSSSSAGGVTAVQVQQSSFNVGIDSGSADAYVVTCFPAITSLTDGLQVTFTPLNSNLTAYATVNVGTGVKDIVLGNGNNLLNLDFIAGTPATIEYSVINGSFQLLNPQNSEMVPIQIAANFWIYNADIGIANAYVVNTPLNNFYNGGAAGTEVLFTVSHANTGASTLAYNGGSPLPILNSAGYTLDGGELLSTGIVYSVLLSTTLSSWILQNSSLAFANPGINNNITSMTGLSGYLKAPIGIKDTNGLIVVDFLGIASAVNFISINNSLTGIPPGLVTHGSDSTIGLSLQTKAENIYLYDNTGAINPALCLFNAAATHYVGLRAPILTANQIWNLPAVDGTTGQFLKTDGSGNLSFATGAALDANSNLSANNFIEGYTSTVTAAGTTTLTVASAEQQYFTGSTTQTVLLPVTSTLVLGQKFIIVNNSSGVVTVQSSGANTIQAMAASSYMIATCILTSGTSAASWSFVYGAQVAVSSPWASGAGTNSAIGGDGTAVASGTQAIAYGSGGTSASGANSIAIGQDAKTGSSASNAVAMGYQALANGGFSVALGRGNTSTGTESVSLGAFSTATGNNSVAIGNSATATNNGSFSICDGSGASYTLDTTTNQFAAAFANGYIFKVGSKLTLTVDTAFNFRVNNIGSGLAVAEGSNAKQGVVTLSSGVGVVSNTSVTANSRIFYCAQDTNTIGFLTITARTSSSGFTITSSVLTDSGVVAYELFEPA